MIRKLTITATVLAFAVMASAGTAQAKWSALGSGSPTVGATTMRNTTSLTAACLGFGQHPILLTWPASLDTWVDSYLIKRIGTRTGTSNTIGTSVTATTGTNSLLDSPPTQAGDSYTYTVQTVRLNWITGTVTSPKRTYATTNSTCA
jgi:hypothetical protein